MGSAMAQEESGVVRGESDAVIGAATMSSRPKRRSNDLIACAKHSHRISVALVCTRRQLLNERAETAHLLVLLEKGGAASKRAEHDVAGATFDDVLKGEGSEVTRSLAALVAFAQRAATPLLARLVPHFPDEAVLLLLPDELRKLLLDELEHLERQVADRRSRVQGDAKSAACTTLGHHFEDALFLHAGRGDARGEDELEGGDGQSEKEVRGR